MNQLKRGVCLVASIMFLGCGGSAPDSSNTSVEENESRPKVELTDDVAAANTLAEMLEVAKRGDWGEFVDKFYGEQEKFRSSDDREQLVKRFEGKYAETMVAALTRCVSLPVRIDGDTALFKDGDEIVYALHRNSNTALNPTSQWTFHL